MSATANTEPTSASKPPPQGLLAGLHWAHMLVVALSLSLTFGAWWYSRSQLDRRVAAEFERQADQVIELIRERMALYENALYGGIGAIQATGGQVRGEEWASFARGLGIERRYPGISGIGVIYRVERTELEGFLATQRRLRPDFHVHPERPDAEVYWPITYLEPSASNRKAIGLDMAHEAQRYEAANAARDSGETRITGPIVLVQDAKKTPGFLFYAPYYRGAPQTEAERRRDFAGMVYAPFVVHDLLDGALVKEKRSLGVRLRDGDHVLYDEHVASESDHDPAPLFTRASSLDLYGRTWTFELASSLSFRERAASSQPLTILLAGIVIDSLLLFFFILLARGNHQLQRSNRALDEQAQRLHASNEELEQFAFVASHDLQEPLRMVRSFVGILDKQLPAPRSDLVQKAIGYIVDGSGRMQGLIEDLLDFSRAGRRDEEPVPVELTEVIADVQTDLSVTLEARGGRFELGELPAVLGNRAALHQLFLNLCSNALKFNLSETPLVQVLATCVGDQCVVEVKDNGIGIPKDKQEHVFGPFKRLHVRAEFEGNGIGLAVCAKIVARHGGTLTLDSSVGVGSTFRVSLPRAPAEP